MQQPEKLAQCNPTLKVSLDFHGQYNSWFSTPSMQATTTHFWLHSVTLPLEAVPVCSSPALIPVFELWKIHFLFAHPVERKKAIYTHVYIEIYTHNIHTPQHKVFLPKLYLQLFYLVCNFSLFFFHHSFQLLHLFFFPFQPAGMV